MQAKDTCILTLRSDVSYFESWGDGGADGGRGGAGLLKRESHTNRGVCKWLVPLDTVSPLQCRDKAVMFIETGFRQGRAEILAESRREQAGVQPLT